MNWNKKLWGIEFTGNGGKKILIGSLWDYEFMKCRECYDQEPTRALLFCTREAARKFCKLHSGRLRPVRVVETVRKI